jgi:ABC-type Fe3+-hydroxamate transport system substrate-binding protein
MRKILVLIPMKRSKALTLAVILAAMMMVAVPFFSSESTEAETISVTDPYGNTAEFDAPVNKIVTLGFGLTLTVIDAGCKDKILAVDKYSVYAYNKNSKVKDLTANPIGSVYASDADLVVANMIQFRNIGLFNPATDVIVMNFSSAAVAPGGLVDQLQEEGFITLCYGSSSYTYDSVVKAVSDVVRLVGGNASIAERMVDVKASVSARGADLAEDEKPKAMYVSDSSGTIRVYNTGVAADMILLANGMNVGNNGSGASHVEEVSFILQAAPDVIFMDGNYPLTEEQFKEKLGTDSIKVVKLEKEWNSYGPSTADGLEAISEALYGPMPEGGSILGDLSITTVAVAGGAVIVVIIVAAFFLSRRG